MNIFIFSKSKMNINDLELNQNYNKIYFIKNNFFNQLFYLLKIKKEKNIQILINNDYNLKIFFKILSFISNISFVNLKDIYRISDLEKVLQHKIAYKRQKDIPVLMYHRVITSENEKGVYDTAVTLENFEKQMKYLKENDFDIITFKELKDGRYIQRFDKKYIIITFDDGYKDNYYNVLPVMKKYNIPFVLYLVSDSEYNEWDVNVENRPKEKRFELMNDEEIKEMKKSGLVEFGGHTRRHLNMVKADEDIIQEDLKISKKTVEEFNQDKLISFAYPWGANNKTAQKLVKENGYQFAVSTESGTACFSDNLFEIKRVGIYYKDDMKKFRKKSSGHYTFMQENRDNRKKFRNKLRKIFGLKTK